MQKSVYYLVEFIFIFFLPHVKQAHSSKGDRSWVFDRCRNECVYLKCSSLRNLQAFANNQSYPDWLLGWDCERVCEYDCMWRAVDAFIKDKSPVPQFYGKWPFKRFLGLQEPASVLFSLLNGLSVAYMMIQFRKCVPKTAPMYYVWQVYGLVAINAWIWSIIFHAKDTPLTEKLDYFCALSLVLSSLYALCLRVIGTQWWKVTLLGIPFISFYINHVTQMYFKIDYGYNMIVNIGSGLINAFGWLIWSFVKWKKYSYVRKCLFVVVALNVLLLLEVGDFPPLLWIFDAHSLWHLGTSPLPLVWFRFTIEDCITMWRENEQRGDKIFPLISDISDNGQNSSKKDA